VRKRCWGHSGVWRQKGPKAIGVNQGELFEEGAGVQAGRSAEEPESDSSQSVHISEEAQ
jgi:hypothetical protein